MIVRCGNCRSQFEVPGPGRFSCPVCGSVNMVRAGAGAAQPPGPPPTGGMGGGGVAGQPGFPGQGIQTPPPPKPEPPSPKLTCPECEFSFIVGQIEVATCPMCGAEVETGWKPEDEG